MFTRDVDLSDLSNIRSSIFARFALLVVASHALVLLASATNVSAQATVEVEPVAEVDSNILEASDAEEGAADPSPKDAGPKDLTAGQTMLNNAMERKMTAERMSDLQDVIDLCEAAIEKGLDETNRKFANQLMCSTLYERAERVVESLVDKKLDLAWARRRQFALESLEKAIELNPADAETQLLLARLHELPGGDKNQGLAAAEQAVDLLDEDPPRRSEALVLLATFRTDLEDRLEDFDRALDADAKNAEAYRERGRTYLQLGQAGRALEDFKALIAMDDTDMESVEIVAALLADQKKYDEALELVNGVIEADDSIADGYLLRASILLAKDETESALEDLNSALERDARNLAALMTRAQVYSTQENYEEALADVTRVLELRPDMKRAVELRSVIALAAGDYKRSISDLRRLLRRDPKNVGLRLQIAAVYVVDDRPALAIDIYDRLIEDDGELWEAIRGRADAHLGMGDHDKAVADYSRAIEGIPDDTGLLNNFAWVLATTTMDDLRDGNRAVELAEKACDLTEYKAAHIVSTLAAGYAEIGKFDRAVELSNQAVELAEEEISEQLAAELASYKSKKPWRERKTIEPDNDLSDDLGE